MTRKSVTINDLKERLGLTRGNRRDAQASQDMTVPADVAQIKERLGVTKKPTGSRRLEFDEMSTDDAMALAKAWLDAPCTDETIKFRGEVFTAADVAMTLAKKLVELNKIGSETAILLAMATEKSE